MGEYEITATLVVRLVIRAESREEALDMAGGEFRDTMCWQAWGMPRARDDSGVVRWIDEYPIVTNLE